MQSSEVSSNPYLVAIYFGSTKVTVQLALFSVYLMSVSRQDWRIQQLRFHGFI